MRISVHYISSLALAIFLLISCNEPLIVHQKAKEKLVINGLLQVDSLIVIELSKTRDIFNPEDKIDFIRNAEVYLQCGGNTFDEQMVYIGEGKYQSSHTAKYGESYTLEIVHAQYENVSATAVMPSKTDAYVRYIGEVDLDQSFELEIPYDDKNNFYIWEMLIQGKDGESNVRIYSTDKKTDNILPDESQDRNLIFLNSRNNNTSNLSASFQAENITPSDVDRMSVKLLTVNRDMYQYFKSLELYRNSLNNYAEPVEIHSNVNNGLGIFGAFAETIVSVTK